jgi:hypothetical protein
MKIFCVNKTDKRYKILEYYWEDTMAEAIVESYTKYLRASEFEYPTVRQSIDYIRNKVKDKHKVAAYYFNNEPKLTEEGARKVLTGIIHRLNDDFYVNKGYREGLLMSNMAKKEVEGPNIAFMNKLSQSFPGMISLIPTRNGTKVEFNFETVKKVNNIPLVNEQLVLDFSKSYPNLDWMDTISRNALINAIDKGEIESTCK